MEDTCAEKAVESDSESLTTTPTAHSCPAQQPIPYQTPPVHAGAALCHVPNLNWVEQMLPRPFSGAIACLVQRPVKSIGLADQHWLDKEVFHLMNIPPHPLKLVPPSGSYV